MFCTISPETLIISVRLCLLTGSWSVARVRIQGGRLVTCAKWLYNLRYSQRFSLLGLCDCVYVWGEGGGGLSDLNSAKS